MNDNHTNDGHDFDTLEEQLRTALHETAAQIDPQVGTVPTTDATVTPLRRPSRTWVPALAAAAVVLLLVGVVTLINRGEDGGAPATFDGPVELTLMLPPGVSIDGTYDPTLRFYWDQAVGPYQANLFCGTYADGACTSVMGNATAFFDEDGTPTGYSGEYSVMIGFALPEQPWLELGEGTPTTAEDAGAQRPDGAVDVDVNGHRAFATEDALWASVAWEIGDEMFVEVGSDRGELDDVLEFARSLEEHTVPVPAHTPVVIATIDKALILAGAWDGAELVVGQETENDVASDVACISTFPFFAMERAQTVGYCGAVGELHAWDVPAPDSLSISPEVPDDAVGALPPPSPSGIVVGTAPLDAANVDVTLQRPDGTEETLTTDVVGSEYGFTSGFWAVDAGEGSTVVDVVVAEPVVPEPVPGTDLLLYTPPGMSLGAVRVADPTEVRHDEYGSLWTQVAEPYLFDVWCDEFTAGACRYLGGTASATFEPNGDQWIFDPDADQVPTSEDHPNVVDGYTVEIHYLGNLRNQLTSWSTGDSDRYAPLDADIDGHPATYRDDGDGQELTVRFFPESNVMVEVVSHGPDLDDTVEFARSLEPHTIPMPTDFRVRLTNANTDERVPFLEELTVLVGPDFGDRSLVSIQVHDFANDDTAGIGTSPDGFVASSYMGKVFGITPAYLDEITLWITLEDGTTREVTVEVFGGEFGIGSGFFVYDTGTDDEVAVDFTAPEAG